MLYETWNGISELFARFPCSDLHRWSPRGPFSVGISVISQAVSPVSAAWLGALRRQSVKPRSSAVQARLQNIAPAAARPPRRPATHCFPCLIASLRRSSGLFALPADIDVPQHSKPEFNLIYSVGCGKFTKTAKATGLENIGPERTISGLLGNVPVNSPTRITPENNGKIRPQPDRENAFARASGGDEGIRTLETL